MTRGQVAQRVARHKELHGEEYCPFPRCLWHTGGGYCPRHMPSSPVGRLVAEMATERTSAEKQGSTKEVDPIAAMRLMKAAPELLHACKWFMAMLDCGTLVRNISRDGQPDYAMRMMGFVMNLKKAQAAISDAEGSDVIR